MAVSTTMVKGLFVVFPKRTSFAPCFQTSLPSGGKHRRYGKDNSEREKPVREQAERRHDGGEQQRKQAARPNQARRDPMAEPLFICGFHLIAPFGSVCDLLSEY
jgi:hypothetical protein